MSEVRNWLESIGLPQYADTFETNDLDIDLLRQVDDQLLKEIGVASAGHRLRIRNAIAKLGARAPGEIATARLRRRRRDQPSATSRYRSHLPQRHSQCPPTSKGKANVGT